MFHIAIAVAAISALTKKRHFRMVRLLFGAAGCICSEWSISTGTNFFGIIDLDRRRQDFLGPSSSEDREKSNRRASAGIFVNSAASGQCAQTFQLLKDFRNAAPRFPEKNGGGNKFRKKRKFCIAIAQSSLLKRI